MTVPLCANLHCGKLGHTKVYCIKPDGGVAEKTIKESKAACKAAQEKKSPTTATPKIPITVKDVNNCAFMVMVNSAATSPYAEFVGLISDPLPAATINNVEYEGWVAIEEEATTTIKWVHHTSISSV